MIMKYHLEERQPYADVWEFVEISESLDDAIENAIHDEKRRPSTPRRIVELDDNDAVVRVIEPMHSVGAAMPEVDPPAITGSEKQIAWASKIRDKLLDDARRAAFFDAERARKFADAAAEIVSQAPSASWWIDHRDMDAVTMLNNYTVRKPRFSKFPPIK
jgi:hypothetical protein